MMISNQDDMETGSKTLVKSLETQNVKYIFGIPGTHVLSVYDELSRSSIKTILVTQEQSAGFMADVYGRVSHTPGVILVTSGPGLLNTVNATAQAFVESSPVVIIGSQCNQKLWGKGLYHELKSPNVQLNIFKEITKISKRVHKAEEISHSVSEIFFEVTNERARPVFLEIPEDVFEQSAKNSICTIKKEYKKKPSKEELNQFMKLLELSSNPILIAGGGVVSSESQLELLEFSKLLNIPITNTFMGKSACPTDFENYAGLCSGILAIEETRDLLKESDLVIALGTRFNEIGTGFFTLKLSRNLVHVDIDPTEFNKNYSASLTILSDIKEFLKEVTNLIKKDKHTFKLKQKFLITKPTFGIQMKTDDLVNPALFFKYLFDILRDKKTVFIGDSGNSSLWLIDSESTLNHLIITPSGYNSMGFSVPGAIGAKLAAPERIVIAVCGDGSFLMTGLEFLTAIKYGIKIIVIVLHDNLYNILTFFQNLKYGGRLSDTIIKTFDFAKFANDLGALGISINSNAEINSAITKALAHSGPCLLDVKIDSAILPRLLSVLKNSSGKK